MKSVYEMTPDEVRAEAERRRELQRRGLPFETPTPPQRPSVPPPTAPIEGAFLRIPWSCLVSDNTKWAAVLRWVAGTPIARLLLTAEYRRARDAIKRYAADAMGDRPALDAPLAIEVRVWVPDNHRRDIVNFSKALHDGFSKVVYTDDHWLHDVRWLRAGVDVDGPRAEVTITPIRR